MFISKFGPLSLLLMVVLSCHAAKHQNKKKSKSLVEDDFLLENEPEKNIEFFDAGIYSGDDDSSDCESPAAKRNTDAYVDKVLHEVRPKLPEPFFLPERSGRFRLLNGTVSNLQSMRRTGSAMVRCTDRTFSFLVPIGFRNLTGRYYWETDAGVPVFRGFIDLFAGDVEADVMYSRRRGSLETEESPKATIDKLKITKLEGLKVHFDGLGPLNRFASSLSNFVAKFFSRALGRTVEGPIKNIINKELKNVGKYEKYYF